MPLALTLPVDDGVTTRRLIRRFLKKLGRDLVRLPPELFSDVASSGSLLGWVHTLASRSPNTLFSVLRRPHVHVLLTCAWRALSDDDLLAARERAQAFLVQLAFELALEGAIPKPGLSWRGAVRNTALTSPSRGAHLAVPEGVEDLGFTRAGVAVAGAAPIPWAELSDTATYRLVAPGVVLAQHDNNPISDFEAHPDKTGNQLDLGDAPVEAWRASLVASLDLIERQLPVLRAEMDLVLQTLVPVGTDDQAHLSASYREAIGQVYLTLHPKLMTMAEALVHEYQHNKLNMLFHLDPVMENAYWPLYKSPVRPDPRPLHGVMLAAHAFVPVAEMYRRMADSGDPEAQRGGFEGRWRQIVAKNTEALDVLVAHAQPSPAGRQVIDEMVALNNEHRARVA